MAVITKTEFESRFTGDELSGIARVWSSHLTLMNWFYLYEVMDAIDTDSAVLQFVLSVMIDEAVISESSIPGILA